DDGTAFSPCTLKRYLIRIVFNPIEPVIDRKPPLQFGLVLDCVVLGLRGLFGRVLPLVGVLVAQIGGHAENGGREDEKDQCQDHEHAWAGGLWGFSLSHSTRLQVLAAGRDRPPRRELGTNPL